MNQWIKHVSIFLLFLTFMKIMGAQVDIIYLAVINIVAFLIYAVDKNNAIYNRRRVREKTLINLALIGGSAGSLFAMHLVRHKTRKEKFAIGVPVILAMQIAVLSII